MSGGDVVNRFAFASGKMVELVVDEGVVDRPRWGEEQRGRYQEMNENSPMTEFASAQWAREHVLAYVTDHCS